jgi:hypothetical protein
LSTGKISSLTFDSSRANANRDPPHPGDMKTLMVLRVGKYCF